MNKKLQVLHINTEKGWRGGERQVSFLISGLKEKNVDNFLFCRNGSPLISKCKNSCKDIFIYSGIKSIFKIISLIKTNNIEYLNAHTSKAHSIGLLIKLFIPSIKLFITRRVDFHRSSGFISQWKYTTKLVDAFISVSENIKKVLVKDGVDINKIKVVPDCVNLNEFVNVKEIDLRIIYSINKDRPIIINPAALVGHKDQKTLINAVEVLVKKYKMNPFVVIAGEGILRESLEKQIKSLGLENNVILPGFISNIYEYIKSSDLFVMSSNMEGMGSAVLDAFALKTPVVTTNAGGLPELVKDGYNGFLAEKENAESLADKIVLGLGDELIVKNAAEFVQGFGNVEHAEKYIGVYDDAQM